MTKKIILKELALTLFLLFLSLASLAFLKIVLTKQCIIYFVILFVIFSSNTLIFDRLKKKGFSQIGWLYASSILFGQIILLALMFVFFDPKIQEHKSFVIISLISYLLFLILDTKWKIKWLFAKNE